ncbi:zinc-dependent metalloprotease [Luteimicrobium subarcticum]|uniref:Putative hydrolase n=1 Tax=Luteimicrobium subarcticum TaxID=620910 RepID=A0A2M8WUX6_9MICO|nr:zinc-dependent metalloprotease [Luteimicrobium subarcticum]PJI94741.1 putative hydrolase [Luteimicrobium subarcticum]
MTAGPDQPHQPDDANRPSSWEDMLRSVFGADADEALRELRARGFDPEALGATSDLAANPQLLGPILDRVQSILTQPGAGPLNADVAHDLARQVAVTGGDPSVTLGQQRAATDALAVADLWLDAATELPPSGGERLAWSRSEWVERTLPAWNTLAAPVASSMSDALSGVLGEQLGGIEGSVPGLPALPGLPAGALGGIDPAAMFRSLGSAVFGMQLGQAAGTLSREVFGATDVGVPLLPGPATVLVPSNVDAFAEGLDVPVEEVRLFLALREDAHARLFTHVAWLRAHLLGLVEAYARGITIDLHALEDKVADVDLSDMDSLRGALSSGVFGLEPTPEQTATLERLETTLALVEGWVDEVTARAAAPHLPHVMALREMVRRRRAAGGPAEQTFASLVGLELRPRRSRDAAALWALIAAQEGEDARDHVWDHPDLLPTAEDLDDPAGYRSRREAAQEASADLDAALAEILGEADAPDDAADDPESPREP